MVVSCCLKALLHVGIIQEQSTNHVQALGAFLTGACWVISEEKLRVAGEIGEEEDDWWKWGCCDDIMMEWS